MKFKQPSDSPLRVAYHDGPPAIHFAGRPWRRGAADDVTPEQWSAMRARADFNEFDFKPEPAATPATLED
jgi:hypothetical protein